MRNTLHTDAKFPHCTMFNNISSKFHPRFYLGSAKMLMSQNVSTFTPLFIKYHFEFTIFSRAQFFSVKIYFI